MTIFNVQRNLLRRQAELANLKKIIDTFARAGAQLPPIFVKQYNERAAALNRDAKEFQAEMGRRHANFHAKFGGPCVANAGMRWPG